MLPTRSAILLSGFRASLPRLSSPLQTLAPSSRDLPPPDPLADLVRFHLSSGDTDGAVAAIRSSADLVPPPSPAALNPVFSALSRTGQFASAISLFDSVSWARDAADLVTFNILIHCGCQSRQFDVAHQLFNEIRSRGYTPDVVSFNSLIKGLCDEHRVSDAFGVLDEMKQEGIVPNSYTYSMLIGLVTRGSSDSEKGLNLIREMLQLGLEPSRVNLNCVLLASCKEVKIYVANALYGRMSKSGILGDVISYTCFVNALCKKKMLAEAKTLFSEMQQNGAGASYVG
ncbi:hypothetical protein OPV22_033114 [Ensete ventricosum]|uniref:Pentacotripeptide-repeat region of PRORP domain-containing protein n=1 Tax=Ensete ventricosum TaxID=4639 RepID=A0AAV8Q098_ENSVE|nr:hypothetical protein OPV22_033114 [Ensete ventricosum]